MAQFGQAKNPPWARDNPSISQPGIPSGGNLGQQQVGMSVMSQPGVATQTVYSLSSNTPVMGQHQYTTQQIPVGVPGLPQPQIQPQMAAPPAVLPQPGIAIPTTLATSQVATVSYPAPRPTVAPPPGQPQPGASTKQRVFTGTVTKLHDNFGFVDEDVFFQTSCVKGMIPNVGDRVLVEASYNANMPFKWNATRIQTLPNQTQVPVGPNQNSFSAPQPPVGYNTMKGGNNLPPPVVITPSNMSQPPPPLMGQQPQPTGGHGGIIHRGSGSGVPPSSGRSRDQPLFRERDRGDRGRDRDRGHREERRERRSPRKRSRSPRRSRSPSSRNRSPQRNRRPARIVPRYMVQIPKLSLDTHDANVIAVRSRYSNLYIPSDFFNTSFTWVDAFPLHRPFQLGQTCNFHVMHKDVEAVDKFDSQLEPSDADHLYSAKVMLLSIPSLEELYHKSCALAEDTTEAREAFQHPTRLVQFLVGLRGKSEPMAIGGPWSPSLDGANPVDDPRVLINTAIRTTRALTGMDLGKCTQWYRFAEIRYHRPEEMHKGRMMPARVETVVIFLPDVWSCNPTHMEWAGLQAAYKGQLQDKLAEERKDDLQEEEEDTAEDGTAEKKDPTHFSELDPKSMKVADLRRELEARTLSSKGLKSQLIARLTKAIKTEQEKEEEEQENKEEEEEPPKEQEVNKMEVDDKAEERKKKEEEEKKKRDERDRATRERRYNLPEPPSILVHPSPTAKGGKFDCTIMSLSVLLDYRPEDNKEHSFEVSLFSELFNEMLMRDFGFRIYKALLAAPDRPKDEDKKDHKDKKDKDEKKEKDRKEDDKEKKDRDKEDEKDKEPNLKKRKTSLEDEKDKEEHEDEEEDEKEDDDKDKEKGTDKDRKKDRDKRREKVKFSTMDPDLLLAFVYFDQSHTGYVLDKDVEEVLHTLGLQLSRAQVKKLVQKLVSRDTLNYRKITDRPLVKEKQEGDAEGEVSQEAKDKSTNLDDEEAARGNKLLLPWVRRQQIPNLPQLKGDNKKDQSKQEEESAGEEAGLVMYKGALVDISSIMQRLEKSEKTRTVVEQKLKETQDEIENVQGTLQITQQNSQKLSTELQDVKKKLKDQRKGTENAEDKARRYQDAVMRSHASLSGVVSDLGRVVTSDEDLRSKVKLEQSTFNGE